MHIDHYLKDADQWRSHNPVWCRFVCTNCVVEIGVDESIAVLTIAEHVAWCDPVVVEPFTLRWDVSYSNSYWDHYLVRLWPTSSLDIMKKSYFLKRKSLQHTSNMLTTRLPSSITKLKQMNFWPNLTAFIHPSSSPLKKRKGNVYRFLMSTSKEQMWAWRQVYTGNPLSLASICVGSPLALSNVK